MRPALILASLLGVSCFIVAAAACSGTGGNSDLIPDGSGDDGAASDDSTSRGDAGGKGDSRAGDDGGMTRDGTTRDGAGDDGGIGDSGGDASDGQMCTGLQCFQVACADGGTTTISGVVLDPAMNNPIYDAIVYVPNAKVASIVHGPTCDHCTDVPSGSPIAITLTAADGTFVLPNAPATSNVPLVIQIGKWRRQLTIPTVNACADNPITNHDLTRLPKKKSEGDLPVIAVATGGCDALECLLRKIGIDDSEFTAGGGAGSVQLYQGGSGSAMPGGNTPQAATLWSNASTLAGFDMLINGCECDPTVAEKPQPTLDIVHAWGDKGGRMLDTHYQFYWIDPAIVTANATSPWSDTASFFSPEAIGPDPITADVDTSFPKGQAFAAWLLATKASAMSGQVSISNTRFDVTDVVPPSVKWLSAYNASNPGDGGADAGDNALMHYSFQTPVGGGDGGAADGGGAGGTCGKIAFSDFHSSADVGGADFPGECVTAAMGPEELALEFLFFDSQACLQDDTKALQVPPTK